MQATKTRTKRGSTRNAMLISAAEVMRERGAAGVTIDEVLARSGAPRGSVYYHFPGGRNQILLEALQYAGDAITGSSTMPPGKVACAWSVSSSNSGNSYWPTVISPRVARWSRRRSVRRMRSPQLTTVAGSIFGTWRDALTRAFVGDGFDEPDAASLAIMCIASLEGAVVLCRSARSVDPLRDVGCQIEFLVKSREFVRRHGLPTGSPDR